MVRIEQNNFSKELRIELSTFSNENPQVLVVI
jgi:hypothetical protein